MIGYLSPFYLTRNPSLLFNFIFSGTPSLTFDHTHRSLLHCKSLPSLKSIQSSNLSRSPFRKLSTSALSAVPHSQETAKKGVGRKKQRQAWRESPEGVLKFKLDMCSRDGDLVGALGLYDEARRNGFKLTQYHYNVLIYLCSSVDCSEKGEECLDLGLKRGFEILQQMGVDGIEPNEATFTSAARLAARMEDPEMAFDLVKKMKDANILPRLRSYTPALNGFCNKREADKAYEVDAHMVECGVSVEEPELAALFRLSSEVAREEKVYELLHRLRGSVRQVSESTTEIIEEWFKSDAAAEVGKENWDAGKVKEGVMKGGGGWHGVGWLGKGKWKVERTEMDKSGVCRCCGERLVCIDIDPLETENFASSLSNLACQKEVKADFYQFQEWLKYNGPFDAVIDGANMGFVNSTRFNFSQLKSIVDRLREISPTRRLPLVILHKSRVNGGPAESPHNKKLLESWRRAGALYSTPYGSNDDWYWLYAAVSSKCLLVTNDEMRDHLFQLLGTSFFPRWKEKHQVRLTVFREEGLNLHMPPPYSLVIQESEQGSWHVPTVTGDDIETARQWVCVTRS